MNLCYICNTRKEAMACPSCNRPVCKICMKSFPFSENLCIDCATQIKTGLGGMRKDEDIF
jgi:hypothetical protein